MSEQSLEERTDTAPILKHVKESLIILSPGYGVARELYKTAKGDFRFNNTISQSLWVVGVSIINYEYLLLAEILYDKLK